MKKLCALFSSIKLTIIGGIFLAISLSILLLKIKIIIDPVWITIVICGFPLLYSAITRILFEKRISSALLISMAMIASIFIGELFAAGEVAFIMAIGGILEDRTVEKAKKGLKNLISITPQQGRIIEEDKEKVISIDKIKETDILRILPGEIIPVDGDIIKGSTSVNQSIITGESLPLDKSIGDSVFCGTMNCFGAIDIITTKVGKDSSLNKLIRMVEEAENKKAPTQRIVDKWATWLVPIALILSIITYFATQDITRAVTILVVFCPCALALATPTAIMAAIGQATKQGVIIKSGEALEYMGKVNSIAFDKTGTLTYGNLVLSDIIIFDKNIDTKEFLKVVSSIESFSEHPLAKAIVQYAKKENIPVEEPKYFKMIPGKGVLATVDEKEISCGNVNWIEEKGISLNKYMLDRLNSLRADGKATILVSDEKECIGLMGLSDTIREESKSIINTLEDMDMECVLLTGDHNKSANYFVKKIGIKRFYSELLPEGKVEKIEELKKNNKIVCMIGDGVNDAPSLKIADVGVAMGKIGSDITVEAADIALVGDDISKLPYLKRLSNATMKTIKFSITLSMIINLIAIILSIAGILNPITGALVHNAGSVFVVLIAAALYDRKFI